MTSTDERPNVNYGARAAALANEILRTEVGSGLHGLALAGTDDHDEMGIFVEPPANVFGLKYGKDQQRESYVSRTQPEGVRSGPGDTDYTCYTLRKYLQLAVKGNPTMLLPLFAPDDKVIVTTDVGDRLRRIRHLFLSEEAVIRFLSYMHAQHERMLGYGKRNRLPNRPELVEKYGFDTKYASHALRLAWQGEEIAVHGTLTLPVSDVRREIILDVKTGKYDQEFVSKLIIAAAEHINLLRDKKLLAVPPTPDLEVINNFATTAHLQHWKMKGYLS